MWDIFQVKPLSYNLQILIQPLWLNSAISLTDIGGGAFCKAKTGILVSLKFLDKGGGKCVKIFIKIHQTLNFDENFDAFDMGVKIEKYQKDEKIEFDGV